MKEQIKDSFKESFQHKAPDEFTNKLMEELAKRKQAQVSLLPKAFLWFVVLTFVLGLSLILISLESSIDTALPISQVLNFMYRILPGLILPLCIAALLFLQQVFHYHKIS